MLELLLVLHPLYLLLCSLEQIIISLRNIVVFIIKKKTAFLTHTETISPIVTDIMVLQY